MELVGGEEAEAIAAAAVAADPSVVVRRDAAVTYVESPGRLEISPASVAEQLGRPWGADDLQVILASYFGYIDQWDDDLVVLRWLEDSGHD
jgi:phenol hydroxylase P2 protein